MPGSYRVGVDIGGTFTDLVLMGPDGLHAWTKVASTPADYAEGIVQGLDTLLAAAAAPGDALREIIHATTVATNAILEAKGAVTGLITTAGFRDVLEIRRLRMPHLYNLRWEPPPPLVPRSLRLEVSERVDSRGQIIRPLDEGSVRAAISRLVAAGATSVAVSLINAYRNRQHEERIGALLREVAPQLFVSLSSQVLPEIGEYERTSTTVINAYIAPVVRSYVATLQRALAQRGVTAPVLMMQSAGGMMSADRASDRPIQIIESGPAAGVMGAVSLAAAMQMQNVITLDMGGTTAKASVIEGGQVTRAHEYEVGGGISLSARLQQGAGYALRVPAVDLAEVGAGGGSIAWLDSAGALRVGPHSAGAEPGPACYGHGGQAPTLTDANVVLGYLDPRYLLGGTLPIKADLARQALSEQIAHPLGVTLEEAAYGIRRIAISHMTRAVRAVTVERGRSPGDFALFPFGGSGPLHAAEMAQELGIERVLIPPLPGLFSTVGLLCVDLAQQAVQTVLLPLQKLTAAQLHERFSQVESRLGAELEGMGAPERAAVQFHWLADVRYQGQSFALTIGADDLDPTALSESFTREHHRTYGHSSPDDPVELVNLRVEVALPRAEALRWDQRLRGRPVGAASVGRTERQAYFGPVHGSHLAPVVGRDHLTERGQDGPLIVAEYDTTIVVPPGCAVHRDAWQNVVITVGKAA